MGPEPSRALAGYLSGAHFRFPWDRGGCSHRGGGHLAARHLTDGGPQGGGEAGEPTATQGSLGSPQVPKEGTHTPGEVTVMGMQSEGPSTWKLGCQRDHGQIGVLKTVLILPGEGVAVTKPQVQILLSTDTGPEAPSRAKFWRARGLWGASIFPT